MLSKSIKDKIKAWEGCRLRAYVCPAGVLTIGYGHTGPDVKTAMTITQAQADELFERDIIKFCNYVDPLVWGVRLRQCQYDALVSIAYNIGTGALKKSTLLSKVRANPDDPSIRNEFMKYVYGGGRVLPGLQKRRQVEADHYFGKI